MVNNGYLDAALEQFVEHLVVERGLAPLTLEAYASDLAGLRAFLPTLRPGKVGSSHAAGPAKFPGPSGRAGGRTPQPGPETQRRPPVFRFLLREGLTANNPLEWLDSPKLPKGLPKVLGLEEVDRLLAAPDPTTPLGQRDDAMLELLYATGLRVSELVGLTVPQLDLRRGVVRVQGKGAKNGWCPWFFEPWRRCSSTCSTSARFCSRAKKPKDSF